MKGEWSWRHCEGTPVWLWKLLNKSGVYFWQDISQTDPNEVILGSVCLTSLQEDAVKSDVKYRNEANSTVAQFSTTTHGG